MPWQSCTRWPTLIPRWFSGSVTLWLGEPLNAFHLLKGDTSCLEVALRYEILGRFLKGIGVFSLVSSLSVTWQGKWTCCDIPKKTEKFILYMWYTLYVSGRAQRVRFCAQWNLRCRHNNFQHVNLYFVDWPTCRVTIALMPLFAIRP